MTLIKAKESSGFMLVNVGYRNHMLEVIHEVEKPHEKTAKHWLCKCDCGEEKILTTSTVQIYKSCGCFKKIAPKLLSKHGMKNTRFYNIWNGMKARCYYEKDASYQSYGGEGIVTSDEWLDFTCFMNDMYESYLQHVNNFGEKDTTIDRIDSTKNYCKENCKWSTVVEQNGNRNTVVSFVATSPDGIIYYGRNYAQFALEHGLNKTLIWMCLEGRNKTHRKWTFKRCEPYENK